MNCTPEKENSVTSHESEFELDPFAFLDDRDSGPGEVASEVKIMAPREQLFWIALDEISEQKQLEFAASSDKVRELLRAARNNGMTQKEFEVITSKLRPGRVDNSLRAEGFRGAIWNHYFNIGARMKLISFGELVEQLAADAWISALEKEFFDAYTQQKKDRVKTAREQKIPMTHTAARQWNQDLLEAIGLYSFCDPLDL